uniref:Uncharacterized protein n=1 Tax=Spironucleus salmonicida TaxID=348837 RepID=V6LTX8_9EUKA|eukprot:EST48060.1 Hypothetical protein SS50377_11827 [Spironucleus salmonicida]
MRRWFDYWPLRLCLRHCRGDCGRCGVQSHKAQVGIKAEGRDGEDPAGGRGLCGEELECVNSVLLQQCWDCEVWKKLGDVDVEIQRTDRQIRIFKFAGLIGIAEVIKRVT